MKKTKKYPKVNLENYSKLFMQLGLVLALFVVYVAIEQKTPDKKYATLINTAIDIGLEEDTVITRREEPKAPKITPPPLPIELKVVENKKEIIEHVFQSTEIDETDYVEIIEEYEPEPVTEDVIFIAVEDVPVFPGCKGDRAALTKCFSEKVQKHFARKFDAELPSELGLSSGKKRVHIGFKIDKFGNVIDIKALAPHPKIKKEVIKVMKLLPKMQPGKQRGTPVGVTYAIPLKIIVE